VSLSEPEAPFGRDKEKVYCPLYTAEFMVEPQSLMIFCWDVFAQATDTGTLLPMLDRAQPLVEHRLKKVLVDSGYVTLLDLQGCQQRNIELIGPVQENSFTAEKQATSQRVPNNRHEFIWMPDQNTYACPQGHTLRYTGKQRKRRRGDQYVIEHCFHCSPEYCRGCPLASRCVRDPNRGRTIKRLEGQELLDAQRLKMAQPEYKAQYKERGSTIERPFGDAKRHRKFTYLHGRGLARAKAEVGLLVLAQNIMNLHRLRKNAAKAGGSSP